MGRRSKTILPDGGEVTYTYGNSGELTQQQGARTYPVTYTYDTQGRMATMATYRDGLAGAADTTTWTYDTQRGWLTEKEHADNSEVGYDYYANGTLKKRTWARGISAVYTYDAGGSLTNVNYSDSTFDISYRLDRQGRATNVTDAAGSHVTTYAADGQMSSTDCALPGGWSLQYARDQHGRLTNAAVVVSGSTESSTDYRFDSAGRLDQVSGLGCDVTYGYGPDGRTTTNVVYSYSGVNRMTVSRTFDGFGRLLSVGSTPTNASALSFSYAYNTANQRTSSTLANGSQWAYEYDELGQVTSGKKYFSDGVPVGGAQYEYDFDTIGNRESARNFVGPSSPTETYTANSLNQYTQRTVPESVFVTGTAATNATISAGITNQAAKLANRHGEYFWRLVNVSNSSSPVVVTNVVKAYMREIDGDQTNSLVRTDVRTTLLPKTPETFTYDADGNLLSDGLFTNTWSAENRLLCTESLSAVPDSEKVKVEFTYDYMGRRVEKIVLSDYSGGVYQSSNTTTFVWDGWNLAAEVHHGAGVATNHYCWGLDMSGSLQGAGGIGGLVAMTLDGATPCVVAYDGNGNVMGLVNAGYGSLSAEYEYDPFGNIIRSTGPAADDNPFRFSTKYHDDETGLVYYGYRYYDPELGRWLSRDPIGEDGGLNLYGFVGNEPISRADLLGMETVFVRGGRLVRDRDIADMLDLKRKMTRWVQQMVGLIDKYKPVRVSINGQWLSPEEAKRAVMEYMPRENVERITGNPAIAFDITEAVKQLRDIISSVKAPGTGSALTIVYIGLHWEAWDGRSGIWLGF